MSWLSHEIRPHEIRLTLALPTTEAVQVKKIWMYRDISAPATRVWPLLVQPEHWATWGPSVRSAQLDAQEMAVGGRGSVTTVFGALLRFEITGYVEETSWTWTVEGIEATDHRLETLPDDRCRVGFGVPWIVAPYQAVCGLALQRIKTIAETDEADV